MTKSVLKLIPDPPNMEVVDLLNEYLKKAEAGEIESIAIVCINKDGSSDEASTDTRNFQTLIGGIALLQFKMMNLVAELSNGLDS